MAIKYVLFYNIYIYITYIDLISKLFQPQNYPQLNLGGAGDGGGFFLFTIEAYDEPQSKSLSHTCEDSDTLIW